MLTIKIIQMWKSSKNVADTEITYYPAWRWTEEKFKFLDLNQFQVNLCTGIWNSTRKKFGFLSNKSQACSAAPCTYGPLKSITFYYL